MSNILITGGNSSFAEQFSNSLYSKDLNFIYIDLVKPKYLKNLEKAEFFKIDLTKTESLEKLIKKIINKYKKIDYVVTYASFRSKKINLRNENLNSWNKTISTNLTSNFFLLKNIILDCIKNKNECRIVNVSSISSLLISNESPSYQITKASINHMTRYLATYAGKYKIFVNSILPGMIIKDEFKEKFNSKKNFNYRKIIKKTHAVKDFGSVEDVNKMIKFLLFENNNFINGQCFIIDGGVSIQDQFATAVREFLND